LDLEKALLKVKSPLSLPSPAWGEGFQSPSLDGRGLGEGEHYVEQASRILSNTPSKFSKISLFQNRKTVYPLLSSTISLSMSFEVSSAC
jgi:hypothetical protein